MDTLRKILKKINIPKPPLGAFRFDEPMALHTTFKVGGPADIWIRPEGGCFPEYAVELIGLARSEGIPVFVLGGGANLVVADRGIRGIVLDTGGWTGWETAAEKGTVTVRSGTPVDALVDSLAEQGRAGFELFAGMPGAVGGAVWMNARCQEKSISDLLLETEIIDMDGDSPVPFWTPCKSGDFSYKQSPFQDRRVLITRAAFSLKKGEAEDLRRIAEVLRQERETRGHFRAPSAGSVFKNKRDLGKPVGMIIDELGLRGLSKKEAEVAPWHGNFIINRGNATAADIRALTETLIERVHSALGIDLEPEILFVGDWGD
jgi:UDP-N-acetylmuramate dehydrogenase